jgi:hypothetical protein
VLRGAARRLRLLEPLLHRQLVLLPAPRPHQSEQHAADAASSVGACKNHAGEGGSLPSLPPYRRRRGPRFRCGQGTEGRGVTWAATEHKRTRSLTRRPCASARSLRACSACRPRHTQPRTQQHLQRLCLAAAGLVLPKDEISDQRRRGDKHAMMRGLHTSKWSSSSRRRAEASLPRARDLVIHDFSAAKDRGRSEVTWPSWTWRRWRGAPQST